MRSKILIIESNKPLAGLWQAYLSRHGFDVACAIEGSAKNDLSAWGFPDVVITGLDFAKHIPSGADCCLRALGSKPPHGSMIPVVQLASSHLPKSVRSSLAGSAFRLLEKPLSLQTLLEAARDAAFEAKAVSLRRAGTASMSSGLQSQALFGTLQAIEAAKSSGTLLVESPCGKAFLCFDKAEPMEAACGALTGVEAFLEALSWTEGSATFHEAAIAPLVDESSPLPNIQTLAAEARRQSESMERTARLLVAQASTLQRSPSAKIGGKAPFSEKIFIALEKPCDFETLAERLKSLTRRQLLTAIAGMLEREELLLMSCSSPEELNPQERKAFVETLEDEGSLEKAISLPPSTAVVSCTPRLAKRFIGAACGEPYAQVALLSAGRLRLLLCERRPDELQPDALPSGGALLLFDRFDADSIGKAREAVKRLLEAERPRLLIASPECSDRTSPAASAEELLGLHDDVRIRSFEFTRKSCAALLAELLRADSLEAAPFAPVAI